MRDDIIAGLDIGSNSIRLVVGQRTNNSSDEQLQIIGAIETSSQGINRGAVSSIEETTSSIANCLEKAERLVGVPIENVWVGINGPYIKCEKSRGVVAVSKSDGEITEDDVSRAIEAARALSVPPNYEILHVIPTRFIVDNQEDIKNPIGMTGVRLEVETLIIQGLSSQIKNLTKAIYRTGLDIEDLVLSPLAASAAVLQSKQKELGVSVVNIGSSTTSIAVFEEGEILHAAVIPIGSEHITSDVAIGLRCPINLAEKIKIEHGHANPELFGKKEEVNVKDLIEDENLGSNMETISKKYVAEIIQARTEEIFEKVDLEFKKIERSGMLPAGVFLIGGGAKLEGIVEVAKNQLRLPVSLGSNKFLSSVIDKVNDPVFLTALGLVVWGYYNSQKKGSFSSAKLKGKEVINKVISVFKKLFSFLKP